MEFTHRKIDLQSPPDLHHLLHQLRTAARAKLDLHLPPAPNSSASEPDDLRRAVESRVERFVGEVEDGVRTNVRVNGVDVVPATAAGRGMGVDGSGDAIVSNSLAGAGAAASEAEVEEFEPYDEALRVRLATATAKRDALIAAISKHRRNTPAAAARAWETAFEEESKALFSVSSTSASGLLHPTGAQGDGLEGVRIQRADEVARTWERALEGLRGLNQGLPETRARLERCGEVVGYLEGGRS